MATKARKSIDGVLEVNRESRYGESWTRTLVVPKGVDLREAHDKFVRPDAYRGPGSRFENWPWMKRLRRGGRTWGWMITQSGGYDV